MEYVHRIRDNVLRTSQIAVENEKGNKEATNEWYDKNARDVEYK